MAKFKVNSGVEQFCIESPDGSESPCVNWEEVAAIKVGNDIYICYGDFDQSEQVVEKVLTTAQVPTETVSVLFEGEQEPGDDEEGEPGDDEEDEDDDDDEPGPQLVA